MYHGFAKLMTVVIILRFHKLTIFTSRFGSTENKGIGVELGAGVGIGVNTFFWLFNTEYIYFILRV